VTLLLAGFRFLLVYLSSPYVLLALISRVNHHDLVNLNLCVF